MSAIAAAIAGTAVVGAYSANKASKAQQRSADKASAVELEMFHQSREDQMPWLETGKQGLNQLAHMLGIDGAGPGAKGSGYQQIGLDDLIDNSNDVWKPNEDLYANSAEYRNAWDQFTRDHRARYGVDAANSRGSGIDTGRNQLLGYGFDLDAYNKSNFEQSQQELERRTNDPNYGSLLKNFTEKDFWDDPVTKLGFQYGLDEGTKGLNRQLSSVGGLNSGAALKALTRFATDYTGTKGNEAFSRFNINQDKTYNRLATLAGVGQNTSAQMGSQALQTGQSIGNNLMDAGNARASGYIGMANAVNGAVGMGVNAYQTNQLIKRYPLR